VSIFYLHRYLCRWFTEVDLDLDGCWTLMWSQLLWNLLVLSHSPFIFCRYLGSPPVHICENSKICYFQHRRFWPSWQPTFFVLYV